MEVKSGEYIVIHLRTAEEGWVNETGDNLSLSGGTDALPASRDLWIPESKKRLHKNDLVYLVDQDDKIIDGVVLSGDPGKEWSEKTDKGLFAAAALFAEQGAWYTAEGGEVMPSSDNAVNCGPINTSVTKSISRYENRKGNTAADWYLSSAATPGAPNKP
jgi:hypothetical protein